MPSCTDPLKLNDNELFKELKNSFSKSDNETQNILEIRDDILYVWNSDKCCILTLNLAVNCDSKNKFTVSYQTLQPTDPPIFEITNLLINETATQLVLWGNLGIGIVELPRRWGKDNLFQGGKSSISCLNHNLNGINAQLSSSEVRRVRWHPGSPNDSHLLVLTSENSFQLYKCPIGQTPKLIKNSRVGATPTLSPNKKRSTIQSLGDTAVDFDFTTPTIKNINKHDVEDFRDWTKIEWPILVLRGDGSVFLVQGNILSNTCTKPLVLGSLSIYPAMYDNYGVDSCSIMCIQTTPPIVIIATSTGIVYHAILLRDNFANEIEYGCHEINQYNTDNKDHSGKLERAKTWSEYGSNYSLHTPDDGLFVFEQLEMELGLLFKDNDKKYNCIINLHKDRGNKSRYFCTHNAGIHMITVSAVSQLQEYLNCNEDETDLHLPSSLNTSTLQYLLCTRTKHTKIDDPTPILGFGVFQQTCPILIALLHTGVVVDFSVIDLDYLPRIELPEPTNNGTSWDSYWNNSRVTREPFDNYIRSLLKQPISLPITKLGNTSNLSGRECFELLDRITTVLRKYYFTKHDKARSEISKKVRTLKALKNHQLKELEYLMQIKEELHEKAQQLAERYEDVKEFQENLAKRAGDVLRLVNQKELTAAERSDAADLRELNNKVEEFKLKFDRLKTKVDNQQITAEVSKEQGQKSYTLSSKQEEAIKTNVTEMSKNIKDLVTEVKKLEYELEI